ncbi:MAG: glycerophosphodiester phosphodiesterase family protein, partial [Bacteroidota bacterium]
ERLQHPTKDHVLAVSHRGDWRYAPENSLMAVQRCIDLGVDIVEIDVRMTKDGHLVAMHDKTVDRTTNGSGCQISRLKK